MKCRVKICCIGSVDEAEMAVRYGASALGLVSEMPSGPGVIPDRLIALIAATIPPGVESFLLTSRQCASEIIDQQRRLRVRAVQLCDRLVDGSCSDLRQNLPGISLIQVVHVRSEDALAEAMEIAPHVDAILLDSGNPQQEIKELGGTGQTHDWNTSRRIREAVPKPVYLAGGLRPDNVAKAIATVGPFAVDVCSGVRTDDRLDEGKLSAFFRAVHDAAGAQ